MLPLPARSYLVAALDHTPATLSALLLARLPAGHPSWNTRPAPDRFSLREIVAHLADWEVVWQGRFERTIHEDIPRLDRPDLDLRAEEQGYGHTDPQICLNLFQERRSALTNWLRALPEEYWQRAAHLERIGDLPLEGLVALALGHDSYHVRQIAEWLEGLTEP